MPNIDNTHRIISNALEVPPRILLGPGPSNAHPRVLQALAMRQVGHLDPSFLEIMGEIQELLRYVFQTSNEATLPISSTGTGAMQASLVNVIEPGDIVLVGIMGYFGQRLAEMARRLGAEVRTIEKEWGKVFTFDEIRAGLETHRPAVLALVHGETSSGACQPMEGIGPLCREHNCLLLVDTVASLGGVPFFSDDWQVDIVYSGSQKCISCPPGVSPLTYGHRAMEKLAKRQTPVVDWYLDLSLLMKYWGSPHAYHHTAPINMNYGLREALSLIAEEGLEARWARHDKMAQLLWDNLEQIGLECFVEREWRLASLTTIKVPAGVDAKDVANRLLHEFNIEIAGGFGPLAGKVWRVGLMGFNSRRENVTLLIEALKQTIPY